MQKAILFLPDISGFTEFVKNTEVQHSKHIIKELLELLIDQNQIGLELAEIEGDALFFYKLDDGLSSEDLVNQILAMHQAFHQHLQLYKYRRICNCGACTNAEGLKLKFVVHEANIDFIEVKSSRKPYGEDVITAHRLLKNSIPVDEYVLSSTAHTTDRISELTILFDTAATSIEEQVDGTAHRYYYFTLDQSKTKVNVDKDLPQPVLGHLVVSNQINIDARPNDLFQFILDFTHRHLWSEGIDKIIFKEGEINQIGSTHTCVIGGKDLELSTIYKGEKEGELIFIESTEDAPIVKNLSTVFKISPSDQGSLVEINVFTKSTSFLGKMLRPILRIKLNNGQSKSLVQLKKVVEDR